MDGRVLAEAFETPPASAAVATWETSDAAPHRGNDHAPDEAWSVLRQFAALGYVDDPGDHPDEALRNTGRENRWNLARAFLDARRFLDALPLLEAVHADWPERRDYAFELAVCQFHLGLLPEARETASMLVEHAPTAAGQVLMANILFRLGDYHAAMECLQAAETVGAASSHLHSHIGTTRLRLRQYEAAAAAYARALELDPEDVGAHLGLAHCHLRAGHYEAAAEGALRAVGLRFDLPWAHHHLGVALARLGDDARAIQALETCLRYFPAHASAHRYLAVLHARQPEGREKAAWHRAQLNVRPQRQAAWSEELARVRREAAARAVERADARARRRALVVPVTRADAPPDEQTPLTPEEFIIVSGLPRSGTSLMMQMLAAGGLEPMRDDLRPADVDNERGYYEWQEIKKLPGNPRLIEKTRGRVTKVISALLPWLPKAHRFRIVFMLRPLEETARSQDRMRARRADPTNGFETTGQEAAAIAGLRGHRQRVLEMLRASENVELLEVEYADLLANPLVESTRVAEFVGLPVGSAETMAAAVDPNLRHFCTPPNRQAVM